MGNVVFASLIGKASWSGTDTADALNQRVSLPDGNLPIAVSGQSENPALD